MAPALDSWGYYLGGGTAIAIHLGHRRSLDFDWFTQVPIDDPLTLAAQLRERGVAFEVGEIAKGTLHGTANGVRTALLEYRYPHLAPPVALAAFTCRLASLEDLAAMKLSAIAGRGSRKDFVDLYALGQAFQPLAGLVHAYQRRYAVADLGHLLYALSYFDDAETEPMPDLLWDVEWPAIRQTIEGWVRAGIS
jgi:hypothetical protein